MKHIINHTPLTVADYVPGPLKLSLAGNILLVTQCYITRGDITYKNIYSIQGVSGGIVNTLGGGSMDYSK